MKTKSFDPQMTQMTQMERKTIGRMKREEDEREDEGRLT
jgi:hypothetical protein